jgi:hypothetical protein
MTGQDITHGFHEKFVKYAASRTIIGKITRKYLLDMYDAMEENSKTMIKNRQLAVFNKSSIPVYELFLRGKGYHLGTIKKTDSGYLANVLKN